MIFRDFMLSLGGIVWTVAIGIWAAIITLAVMIRYKNKKQKKKEITNYIDLMKMLEKERSTPLPNQPKSKKMYVRKRVKKATAPAPAKVGNSKFHNAYANYYRCTGNSVNHAVSNKGMLGEMQVYAMAGNHFGFNRVLANVYLPRQENGQDYETDLIILTPQEIYVLEVKNWKGKVVGDGEQRYWKHIFDGKEVDRFNPFWQNYGHVRTLEESRYKILKGKVFPLVVFNSLCEVIVRNPYNNALLKRDQFIPFIQRRQSKIVPYFTENDMNMLYDYLLQFVRPDKAKVEKHNQFVQSKTSGYQ